MPGDAHLQRISAGVMLDIIGQPVVVTGGGVPVAVWPAIATGGKRATQVIVRPVTNPVWLRINTPALIGGVGAELSADTEYVFPLAPAANTLYFIAPVETSVILRWVIGD